LPRAVSAKPKTVIQKNVNDLVTEFDMASEDLIRERLSRETPHIPVVAEERGGTPDPELSWYVDPIDGTTNYAHGHPIWCVSIGLVSRGAFLAGVVVAPPSRPRGWEESVCPHGAMESCAA